LSNHLSATFIRSIDHIEAADWNALCGTDYPFLRHEFFYAMEASKSTTEKTGWQAHHLLISQLSNDNQSTNTLVAIMPLFIKTHSYGEYVFDWSWADAYHRHGKEYYPKLLNAIPFTPATGARWAIKPGIDHEAIISFIKSTIILEAEKLQASSFHCLFPNKIDSDQLSAQLLAQLSALPSSQKAHEEIITNDHEWLQRSGYQYHWFNDSYKDFDDFLSKMSSRKKKNIKKERLKVDSQNISLVTKQGSEISEEDWNNFYLFYQMTYLKRSGRQGYLSSTFFPLLAKHMPEHLVMIQAQHQGQAVAAALCFKDSETLYGRYWGCKEDFDSLHFETCYYQGIEYAIRHQLKRFDPGAQGEHKIQRGFTPIKTYSNHYLLNTDFHHAIKKFINVETQEVEQYIEEASSLLPFKKA